MLAISRACRARSSPLFRLSCCHGFSTSAAAARVQKASGSKKVFGGITKYGTGQNINREPLRTSLGGNASATAQLGGPSRINNKKAHALFRNLCLGRLDNILKTTGSWAAKSREYSAFGLESEEDLQRESATFRHAMETAFDMAFIKGAISQAENPLFHNLRQAFVMGDIEFLEREVKYAFQNFLMRSRFSKAIATTHRKIGDCRFPHEWFPATRAMRRKIHVHVGPTNSGKTYRALKALENAKTGIYAGPLRLLAHEVYSRFMAKGKPCALITGEEQRIPADNDVYFRSCTVEMTPLNEPVDVAIIDEIQMIGDVERGWAWTQAFLGVQAKEVHLCGEERAVELIQSLCGTTGDECIIHRYERLSPLEASTDSLRGNLNNLQKGDAIISFSRIGIHSLKKLVERKTGRRCAIVYGSLPPETRAQQAALFNDPDNDYDFLVASDAIGMGLNLEIKRVIFEQTQKRDRFGFRAISTSELKQIGGRAGRFRTANAAIKDGHQASAVAENVAPPPPEAKAPGIVTCLEDDDIQAVQTAFKQDPEPIKTAGIQIPPSMLERFSAYFPPNTPLSYIIIRLRDIAAVSSRYHMCSFAEMADVADLIQPYPMSIFDRCVFLNAPVALRENDGKRILQAFAKCASDMSGGHLLEIPGLNLEILEETKQTHRGGPANYLRELEAFHKAITLYLWLSYRYSGVFRSQGLAFHVKKLVEDKIDECLGDVDFTEESRKARISRSRQQVRDRDRRMEVFDDKLEEPEHEALGTWTEEGHQEPLAEDPTDLEEAVKAPSGKKPTSE